ncbi:MAG: hypothetical protein ACRDJK_04720, partial [Actinomycetota bacterium]
WMGLVPARPLLDGLAPPPRYRWIQPPPELEEGNIKPEAGAGTLALRENGTEQASIATPDGQAVVILPLNAISPSADQTEVRLEIAPVDPAGLPPPPERLTIEGNAYRIDATYPPSGRPVVPARPVGVVLRYPIDATTLLLMANGRWREIPVNLASGTLSILAETAVLGTFAPAGPEQSRRSSAPTPPWAYLAAGSALAAAVALSLDGKRRKLRHR